MTLLGNCLWGSYELAVLLKVLLAALAGGLIGIEREKHGRPAGLRTHLLVAVGACLMTVVSEAFYVKYGHLTADSAVRLDPSRVAAQIVTGIGFLGAGVIIKEGMTVRGLTTAASLWLVAGLGMAFGIGFFGPGIIAAGLALFSLIGLKRLEPLIRKDRYLHLTVVSSSEIDLFPELDRIFSKFRLRISDYGSSIDYQKEETELFFVLTRHQKRIGRDLVGAISNLEGVRRIRFR